MGIGVGRNGDGEGDIIPSHMCWPIPLNARDVLGAAEKQPQDRLSNAGGGEGE